MKNHATQFKNNNLTMFCKNLKKVLVIVALTASLFSCSKDETAATTPEPVISNYRMLSAGDTSYEYNSAGKLTKVFSTAQPTNQKTFTYNSQGKLTRTEDNSRPTSYIYYNSNYAYDNTGKVNEKITEFKNTGGVTEIKFKIEYLYNAANQIIRTNEYSWQANNFVLSSSYTTYTYDNIGNLIKENSFINTSLNKYKEFSYDAKRNVIDQKYFRLKTGSTTQYYFDTRFQATYGNNKNPEYDIYPDLKYGVLPWSNVTNFYTDTTDSYYNETSLTSTSAYTRPQYIFNDGGYPIKAVGASVDEYTYQKY